MRKLILLAVLILAFSASIASAVSWTSYLKAPKDPGSTTMYYALTLDVDIEDVGGGLWLYEYTLTNLATDSGLADYGQNIHVFNVSIEDPLVMASIAVDSPTGWIGSQETLLVNWDYDKDGGYDGLAPGASQLFSFTSTYGPQQVIAAAAIDGRAFNGPTWGPTAVPEPSTLVGFGTAMMIAGPSMLGYVRRRRS